MEAKGIWKDGKWTLELARKLNTGNGDDVQFDATKTYSFGMSVFDKTCCSNSCSANAYAREEGHLWAYRSNALSSTSGNALCFGEKELNSFFF